MMRALVYLAAAAVARGAVAGADGNASVGNESYGIVRLVRPWPVGLGRISPTAARAAQVRHRLPQSRHSKNCVMGSSPDRVCFS